MILLAMLLAGQEARQGWQSYGYPGSDTCADWTIDRKTRRTQANEGWVLGFISGLNAYRLKSGGVNTGVNSTSILAWVDQYCAVHPLDPVPTAAFKLAQELQAREAPRLRK